MNKIRVSFLAVAALVLGVVGSAFTPAKTVKTNTLDGWFLFLGGDKEDPTRYTYYGTGEPCDDVVEYCAMKGDRQASPNQDHPKPESISAAKAASTNFTIPYPDLVNFQP